MKRFIETLVGVVLVGVIVFQIWSLLFGSRFQNQSSKHALIKIHESVQIGDSSQRVIRIYEQFKTDRTKFIKRNNAKNWEIAMPFEIGASDWILYLQFKEQGTLSAAIIRTSDGIVRPPPDAPDDKGVFILPTPTKIRS